MNIRVMLKLLFFFILLAQISCYTVLKPFGEISPEGESKTTREEEYHIHCYPSCTRYGWCSRWAYYYCSPWWWDEPYWWHHPSYPSPSQHGEEQEPSQKEPYERRRGWEENEKESGSKQREEGGTKSTPSDTTETEQEDKNESYERRRGW